MLAPFDINNLKTLPIFAIRTQQDESMHTPDRIRVVRIALRLSLAAAFLSAVADRFGWWEPFGQGSWGAWVPSPTIPTSLFRLLLDGY
jgi:hypothetical protein